jgi:hypothetical protein
MIDQKSIPELIARLEADDFCTHSYTHLTLTKKELNLKVLHAILKHYQGADKCRLFASRIIAIVSFEETKMILEELPDVAHSIPNWSVRSSDSVLWELFVSRDIGHKLHPATVAEVDPMFARLNWGALKGKKFINLVGNQSSGFVFGDSIYAYSESAYLYLLYAGNLEEYPPTFAARMCRLTAEEIQEMQRAYRLYIRERTDEYKDQLAAALEETSIQKGDTRWPSWIMSLLVDSE